MLRKGRRSLERLLLDKGWVWDGQVELARSLTHALLDFLEQRGVALTPLALLRVEDVVTNTVLVYRLEQGFGAEVEAEAGAARRPMEAALMESDGKARERLRKAAKELEDFVERAGSPANPGLADQVKPLLLEAHGVLEEALDPEPAPGQAPKEAQV